MYSFNLDYIFNFFYSILLGLRYIWLFWILKISPETYLADHLNDPWDGLRDQNWLNNTENPLLNILDFFSFTTNLNQETGESVNAFTPPLGAGGTDDQNFLADFFSALNFTIQNPILSFFAKVLFIFSIFIFVVFIYSLGSWLWLSLKDEFKGLSPALSSGKGAPQSHTDKKIKHVYTFDQKLNLSEEEKLKKIKEIENELLQLDMPAGISGLPIDENELENEEQQNLKDWRERWQRVKNYMTGTEEALWRIAIMETDNLLNDILIDRGYLGETVAEKLKEANFKTIDLAYEVHRLRNRIAHEGAKFILAESVARKNIISFESVLREFKVLD